jgi:hypothetical protein
MKKIELQDVARIIYWFRRYKGKKIKGNDKCFNFNDITLLEQRILVYLDRPDRFCFNKPDMG